MRTFKPILQQDLANLRARRRRLLVYIALPLAYIVTGRIGLSLAVAPGYATPAFLPAGIAVTATFVVGPTALPGTFLGSFLLNLWIGYLIAGRITALVIAAGSMTQAAIGGAALRRTIGYPVPFEKPSDILLFFLLAPILCLASATISLGGMWALGVVKLPDLPMNWAMWWLGDLVGVLAALPLIIWLADES
jgi:integral membrane sensor domain MASE1